MAGTKQKATNWIAVTPSDTIDLKEGCIGLYIGGAGVIDIVGVPNTPAVQFIVSSGDLLPFEATRVKSTLTTATNIVALY